MEKKPILEEVWRIKDELDLEAGGDLHHLCENIRQWAASHPHSSPRVQNAEELRRFLADQERERAAASALAMNDAPPPKKS